MPTDAVAIADLLEGQAAIAAVIAYADALDARDWRTFRASFEEEIAIDYAAIGSLVATIAAADWTHRCKSLEGFDATAHRIHNATAVINGDRASVTSIVDAAHFVTCGGAMLMGDLIGRYRHELRRHGDRWLIAGVTLTLVGYPAGKPAFDATFAAARAIHAARTSA